MGDVIPFKKRNVTRVTNTVLWGEGQFGFNPMLLKSIFVANDTDICFLFHEPPEGEFDGWELMVRCHDADECKAAYTDLLHIFETQYGLKFGEEQN